MNTLLAGLIREDQSYFEVTPTQAYWLDDNIDREYKLYDRTHGTINLTYEVSGPFDWELFKKSMDFLVRRHESLRATFHKQGTTFFMKVESPDNGLYEPEHITDSPRDVDHYRDLTTFKGHKFDMENGPLFLVRVIKCKPDMHVIAFKIHHVIFDGWSIDILRRDVFVAYTAFASGSSPVLPPLEFQFKDYLALINRQIRINYETDRKYWSEKYSQAPPKVLIPGMKQEEVPVTKKVIEFETSDLPGSILDSVNFLSKKFGISLFEVLQGAFNYYLLRETGQPDILIGTYVLGRDYPGCDAQIGCYAKTVLIRTVLEPDDSFATCLRKVARSNHDMRARTSYPLRYFLEELLPGGIRSGNAFWNINLQFSDGRKKWKPQDAAPYDGPGVRLLPDYPGNSLVQYDMQLSFILRENRLQLYTVYDGYSFTADVVKSFISSFSSFAGKLFESILCDQIR